MRLALAPAIAASLLFTTSLTAQSQAPVPVADLIKQVDIPHQQFTLPNGLRVVVHTDRKAPIVAVSVWYHVGSKDEPGGKTGYAHLYEHLMFNGSENSPGDFFEPLEQVGATDYNGSTFFDRTNYFETVPTPALARALWLESDRMGHMLGAITQPILDNQIGVVQNEKRQGDNQPFGLVQYKETAELFGPASPYGHTPIGSMADLSAASLEDVKGWFRANYGPNNAVLVLAGDVDLATARPLVEKYFGDIPRGPTPPPIPVPITPLTTAKNEVMHDRVATTRLYRLWRAPGMLDADAPALDVAAAVLGGLSSSRLDNALVRQEKLAVGVSADVDTFEKAGEITVQMDVRPGVDPIAAGKRLDALVADFLRTGPTADEVQRVATRTVSARIAGLESVGGQGGKAVALAEGTVYANDPDFYKNELARVAAVTPAQARAAARKWMGGPAYALTVAPGEREPYQEATPVQAKPAIAVAADAKPPVIGRGGLPAVGKIGGLDFPAIPRTRLSNGIGIVYAQRSAVPTTKLALSFDAGIAADPKSALGTQSLMLSLLDEGTATRNSIQIAEQQERLGATIGASASMDRTNIGLDALSANLAPSLELLADIVRNPAFAPAEVERLRNQQLARIAAELNSPAALARRALPPYLFGAAHPYGVSFTGTGDETPIRALTRDQLVAFHQRWIRPDTAQIFVVSDRPLAEVQPLLERYFGTWTAPPVAKGVKDFSVPPVAPRPRILLIDRPQSPQSVILAAQLLPFKGSDMALETVDIANDALAGSFLSRINMDLRESKGWSYGVGGATRRLADTASYWVSAPVQADKTGPAIAALRADMKEFLSTRGLTPAERERAVNSATRSLSGNFETSDAVLAAMQAIELYHRPDDYYVTRPARLEGLSVATLDRTIRGAVDPDKLLWVVVGDAKTVRPQLDALGLPVESITPGGK